MPETRGYTSVRGSNFFDTTVHASGETYNLMRYEDFTDTNSGYIIKDIFYQPDAKAARMFLFINCDLTPYSSTRFDSLMAGSPYTKTIENYSLLALKTPKTAGRSDAKDLILGQSEEILTHVKSIFANKNTFLYRNFPDFNPPKIAKTKQPSNSKIRLVYAGLLGIAQGILKLCKELDFSKIEFHI